MPRMRISRANLAPRFAGTARPGYCRLSDMLEFVAQSLGNGAGLFDEPRGDGKAAGLGHRRAAVETPTRAAASATPAPDTAE